MITYDAKTHTYVTPYLTKYVYMGLTAVVGRWVFFNGYPTTKALKILYNFRAWRCRCIFDNNNNSVADMWQNVCSDLHSRWKAPNFVYKGSEVCWIQNSSEASCEINVTFFILGSVYEIYHFLSSYTFWGLPCMAVQFCVCISKNVCNDVSVPTKIYLCMDLYTYVYLVLNREVVGSSPPGVSYFPDNYDGFKKTFSSWK